MKLARKRIIRKRINQQIANGDENGDSMELLDVTEFKGNKRTKNDTGSLGLTLFGNSHRVQIKSEQCAQLRDVITDLNQWIKEQEILIPNIKKEILRLTNMRVDLQNKERPLSALDDSSLKKCNFYILELRKGLLTLTEDIKRSRLAIERYEEVLKKHDSSCRNPTNSLSN